MIAEGAHDDVKSPRRSPGGYVVDQALEESGLTWEPWLALVETARPRSFPFRAVLCQNAWNFIPRAEFRRLLEEYPLRSRLLYRARRGVARLNVRRASRVIVLSRYMAALVRPVARGEVELVEADLVPSLLRAAPRRPPWLSGNRRFVVVPGTITWYKRPHLALELVDGSDGVQIVFAGADDGSGCLQELRRRAEGLGLDHCIGLADHEETLWLLQHAEAAFVLGALESLSLSLAEALTFSQRVVASDIPVHREVAARIGRTPLWLGGVRPLDHAVDPPAEGAELRQILTERGALWAGVARALTPQTAAV